MALPPAATGVLAVIRMLPRVSRPLTAALIVTVTVQSALPIAFILVSGQLVGAIPDAIRHGKRRLRPRSRAAQHSVFQNH